MIDVEQSGDVCVLRLNAPPLNTFDFAALEELRAALRRAAGREDVRGIVIAGSAEHFSAGADIQLFEEIESAADAVRVSLIFQEALAAVENCPKPVAAAVAGKVLGGALELALACHLRVCEARTRFSMPEVMLGINPGAGGTQRLPRLIGVEAALNMLLTARPIDASRALELGLVDTVCGGDELIERACELVRAASGPRRTCDRTAKVADKESNRAAFERAEQQIAKGRAELIAPAKILEALRAGLDESFQDGLLEEQEVFAQCMATQATRNLIQLFFATRKVGKLAVAADEAAAPAAVAAPAVVGMGSMGTGIVHALLVAGFPVVALDENEAALEKGLAKIQRSLEKRTQQGKLAPERAAEILARVKTTADWQELAGADLVIEAVFEDGAVKRDVLARIEGACSESAIVATNTSTLSVDDLARGMARPERLVGLHFFNPAQRMPLVEVVRGAATSPAATAAAVGFVKALRKTPALVRNRPGFLVNRIFIPYLKEAFALLEEGAEAQAIDDAAVAFGFPMGPLTLIDMSGIDILAVTDEVLRGAFPAHGPLSPIVARLVEAGRLGQKTGGGVYRYERGDYTAHSSEETQALVAKVRKETGLEPRAFEREEITERLVLRLVCEALHVLEEGIAERESDVDVAMVLATGFPNFRGGVLRYARDEGIDAVAARLAGLTERCGERYSPPGKFGDRH